MDWRRLLHTVGQGLATQGAAAVAHEHQAVAGAVRARQIRPRRIAVLGASGGVGTTTVAVLLASVLAAARDDQTLLLTAHCDASDAAARLSLSQAPSITTVVAGLRRHGRIPPSPVTASGVRVLAAPEPGTACSESGLAALLDVAASGHACVVVDAGVAARLGNLARLAGLVDTVVLVSATTPDAVQATSKVMARCVEQPGARVAATRVLLVPVHSRTRTLPRGVDPIAALRPGTCPVHAMPYDGELARGRAIGLSTISTPALTSMLTLAADIMGNR